MNANPDLERRLADFYTGEAPQRAPDRVLAEALATVDLTKQRRVLTRTPWRSPFMNAYAKVAVAAVLVVAVGAIGLAILGPGGTSQQGGPAGPSLSLEPSSSPSISATNAPTPSPRPAPPLTRTFTSTLHGISMSYPEGWTAQAATAPWTGERLLFRVPSADVLYDPTLTDHLFLTFASQPIGDSTPDEWVAEKLTLEECAVTEPIDVDGASGLIGADDCNVAAVATDGRGYLILLYASGEEVWLSTTYDRAWFEEVLATARLLPEEAAAPPPLPALSETFSSPTNAIALSYPTGWRVEPATSEWTTGIPLQGDPFRDLISDPARENTFLLIASQKLGLRSDEQFITETVTNAAWGDSLCQPTTESVPINGIMGSLVTHCDGTLTAVASHGDRGYLFVLFGIDDAAWFREILASAQMG
jgi:hypothetical protein